MRDEVLGSLLPSTLEGREDALLKSLRGVSWVFPANFMLSRGLKVRFLLSVKRVELFGNTL